MEIKDKYIYAMGEGTDDAVKVNSGDTVVFYTNDCFNNQIDSEEYVMDCLDWDHINPAAGPVYIEQAKAGDVLKVYIQDIEIAKEGTMCCLPENGVFGGDITESSVKKLKVENGICFFDNIPLPVKPMIGVIGVAPADGKVNCGTPGSHGGNMDNTKIAKGATLYLPVFRDGAYFACGDVHAVMGDGEIMVSGVEIPAKVTVKLEVVKGCTIANPRLEDDENIYTIASHSDIEQAVYTASKDMCGILQKHLGYGFNDAGMLLSACGNLQFCQVVDPERTVRMAVPKTVCAKIL